MSMFIHYCLLFNPRAELEWWLKYSWPMVLDHIMLFLVDWLVVYSLSRVVQAKLNNSHDRRFMCPLKYEDDQMYFH